MSEGKTETLEVNTGTNKSQGHFKDKGAIIRFDHAWQKRELEEEARKEGRALSNFLLRELGNARGWADRDQETGERL